MGKSLAELEAAFRTQYPQEDRKKIHKEKDSKIAKDTKDTKDVKDFADIQVPQSVKDAKEVKDFADIQVPQGAKNAKEVKDFADIQVPQGAKNAKEVKDFADIQVTQGVKDAKEVKDFADIQVPQGVKDAKEVKDFADIQVPQSVKDAREVKGFADIQVTQGVKDKKEVKDFADIQVTQGVKDKKDIKDVVDTQGTQSAKEAKKTKSIEEIQTKIKTVTKSDIIMCTPRAFIVSEIIFYVSLIIIILCTVLFSGGLLGDKALGGRRFIEMSTPSMESVYPSGALLVVEEVPTSELKVGDDISFVKNSLASVTHRIVEVKEDYEETGARAFVTRGVDDSSDEEEVLAGNVIGRVENSIRGLGSVLSGITRNLHIIIGAFVVLMISSFAIKLFWHEGALKPKKKMIQKI